jgi:hypothetical protein
MMARRSAPGMAAQREISSMLRPHPTQSFAAGSMTQTWTQGLSVISMAQT